jgi:hypothetical protein
MRKLMMALFIAALALPASAGEKQEGEPVTFSVVKMWASALAPP